MTRIKVLVVDDSAVVRQVVTECWAKTRNRGDCGVCRPHSGDCPHEGAVARCGGAGH
jgi:CheY-like chemotaxis protein